MDIEVLSPEFKEKPIRYAYLLDGMLIVEGVGSVMPEQAARDQYRLNKATKEQQEALQAVGYNIPVKKLSEFQ